MKNPADELRRIAADMRVMDRTATGIPSFDQVMDTPVKGPGFRLREICDETEALRQYKRVVAEYQGIQGKDCWRTMELDLREDNPDTLSPIGIHWAFDREGAFLGYGSTGEFFMEEVTFHARIDLGNVDWMGTLQARLHPETGDQDDRFEVRFKSGARLFVYGWEGVNGDTHPINDWRMV